MKNTLLALVGLLLSCASAPASVVFRNDTNQIAVVEVTVTSTYVEYSRTALYSPWVAGTISDGLSHPEYYEVSPGQFLYMSDMNLVSPEPFEPSQSALSVREQVGERFTIAGVTYGDSAPVIPETTEPGGYYVDPMYCSADATLIVYGGSATNTAMTSTVNPGTSEGSITITLGTTLEFLAYGKAPGYLNMVGWFGYGPDGEMLGDSKNLSGDLTKKDEEFVRYFTPTKTGTYTFGATACATYGIDSPAIYVTVVSP